MVGIMFGLVCVFCGFEDVEDFLNDILFVLEVV